MSIGTEYLRVVRERFAVLKGQGDKTFAQLNEEDFYWTMNDASNSIAILIQHVSGNMVSRWTDFLTTDGEKPDRNRDGEFESKRMSKAQLMDCWEHGWRVFLDTLDSLNEQDLEKTVHIRRRGPFRHRRNRTANGALCCPYRTDHVHRKAG